jgi:hypothetical protein
MRWSRIPVLAHEASDYCPEKADKGEEGRLSDEVVSDNASQVANTA